MGSVKCDLARSLAHLVSTTGRHGNLDCGIAPIGGSGSGGAEVPGMPDTKSHLGAQLIFESIHADRQADIA